MKKKIAIALALFLCMCSSVFAQYITVKKDSNGWRLMDGNKQIEIKGMVWAYTPHGETHTYDLWSKPDDYIMRMIDTDMPMLKAMGVNTIRCFSTIPPRWIEYIYEKYGIYTMVNDLLGRYGVTVNGTWYGTTDYSDEYTRKVLLDQARKTAETYRGVKGVIMYMFGNESNYGLVWEGSNIENLPVGEQDSVKAGYLYSLLEEAMAICKDIDPLRPVGFINGDTQYLEIIKELCPSLDILGVNAYRGYMFYDSFFENIEEMLDKPIVFTEAGADAYNAINKQEDQYAQMTYLMTQWKEIYGQAYGKGRSGNILGGYVFEWVDEWWKHYQNKDLDIHNMTGTWSNAGYDLDYRDGINNMDEEWFGICAQSPLMDNGIHRRVPRAAYYMLQDAWKLSIYNSTQEEIDRVFGAMDTSMYMARGNEQSIKESLNEQRLISLDYLDVNVQTVNPFTVDGIKTATENGRLKDVFDPHIAADASVGVRVEPTENMSANAVIKVMNDAPYTGLADDYAAWYDDDDNIRHADLYSASFIYDTNAFTLEGFYHVGHASFENTGDIFNISKEAFDIIGYDTYGSKAPIALQFTGKQLLQGLTIIGGPEIWGGAKPQIMANYWRVFGLNAGLLRSIKMGLVYSEELAASENANYNPYNAFGGGRKISAYTELDLPPWMTFKLGVLHAGNEKLGAEYALATGGTGIINVVDTLGAYAELGTNMFQHSYIYFSGVYRGLVADTNGAAVRGSFFTDDSGAGNRVELNLGAELSYGNFSLKPIARVRTPLQQPAGRDLVQGSPFVVGLGNRQAIEFEAVFTYDPEGATWFHEWNIEDIEGAKVAASLSALYTLYAGKTDPISFKSNTPAPANSGYDFVWYTFGSGLPEQRNLWQVKGKIISNPLPGLRLVGTAEAGTLGSTGEKTDLVTFWKAGLAVRYNHWMGKFSYHANCWAPEEWWRTFNQTFPAQWQADISYGFTTPLFAEPTNRIGLRLTGRVFPDNMSEDDLAGYDPYGAMNGNRVGAHYIESSIYVNIRK